MGTERKLWGKSKENSGFTQNPKENYDIMIKSQNKTHNQFYFGFHGFSLAVLGAFTYGVWLRVGLWFFVIFGTFGSLYFREISTLSQNGYPYIYIYMYS